MPSCIITSLQHLVIYCFFWFTHHEATTTVCPLNIKVRIRFHSFARLQAYVSELVSGKRTAVICSCFHMVWQLLLSESVLPSPIRSEESVTSWCCYKMAWTLPSPALASSTRGTSRETYPLRSMSSSLRSTLASSQNMTSSFLLRWSLRPGMTTCTSLNSIRTICWWVSEKETWRRFHTKERTTTMTTFFPCFCSISIGSWIVCSRSWRQTWSALIASGFRKWSSPTCTRSNASRTTPGRRTTRFVPRTYRRQWQTITAGLIDWWRNWMEVVRQQPSCLLTWTRPSQTYSVKVISYAIFSWYNKVRDVLQESEVVLYLSSEWSRDDQVLVGAMLRE